MRKAICLIGALAPGRLLVRVLGLHLFLCPSHLFFDFAARFLHLLVGLPHLLFDLAASLLHLLMRLAHLFLDLAAGFFDPGAGLAHGRFHLRASLLHPAADLLAHVAHGPSHFLEWVLRHDSPLYCISAITH